MEGVQPITTTRAEAAAVIRRAYERGSLTAQAPTPMGSYYEEQRGRTYRCAVGQLFDGESARRLQHPQTVDAPDYMLADALLEREIVQIDDRAWLIQVQAAHDNIVGHANTLHMQRARVRELEVLLFSTVSETMRTQLGANLCVAVERVGHTQRHYRDAVHSFEELIGVERAEPAETDARELESA